MLNDRASRCLSSPPPPRPTSEVAPNRVKSFSWPPCRTCVSVSNSLTSLGRGVLGPSPSFTITSWAGARFPGRPTAKDPFTKR